MRVVVVGATGVVGRRLLPLLVQGGHEVAAVARTDAKARVVRAAGAEPLELDVFDSDQVTRALQGADALVNVATRIPPLSRAALPGAWTQNDRLRSVASRVLADAAVAAGVGRMVQESVTFQYTDGAAAWIDEGWPVRPTGPARSAAVAEDNVRRLEAAGGTVVVLRFAAFYSADSASTQAQIALARRGISPFLGAADAFQSLLHVDDAASAVVAALGAPPGVYNVADDEPLTRRDLATVVGRAARGRPARILPAAFRWSGGRATEIVSRSHRISNRSFVRATGWSPSVPSGATGWAEVAAALAAQHEPG